MSEEPPKKKKKLEHAQLQQEEPIALKLEWNPFEEIRYGCKKILDSQTKNKKDKNVWIDENEINIEINVYKKKIYFFLMKLKINDKKKKQNNEIYNEIHQINWKKEKFHYFNEQNEELTI